MFEHATPGGHAAFDDCCAPGAGVVGELCGSMFIPNYYKNKDDDDDDDEASGTGGKTTAKAMAKTIGKMHKKGKTAAKGVDLN